MSAARIVRGLAWVYAVAITVTLAMFAIQMHMEHSAILTMILVFLVGLPWILLLDLLPEVPFWLSIAGPILAMLANLTLLFALARFLERRGDRLA